MLAGRRKPYTQSGLARLPCWRCGRKPCLHQWQLCADGNIYRPLCVECDLDLNFLVLDWAGDPEIGQKMASYQARLVL